MNKYMCVDCGEIFNEEDLFEGCCPHCLSQWIEDYEGEDEE